MRRKWLRRFLVATRRFRQSFGIIAEVVAGLLLCSCRSQALRRCSRQQRQSRGGDDVQVVVEDRQAADGDGEVLDEEFESGFDRGLAVRRTLAAEESSPRRSGKCSGSTA